MQNSNNLDAFIHKLNIDTWDKLSPEERLDILQEFENVIAEVENRVALKIKVISPKEYNSSPQTMGYFDGRDIYISPKFLKSKGMIAGSVSSFSIAKAIGTIAHEGRHAWQHYVVEHPEMQIVDDKTRLQMQMNFANYCSPSADENDPLLHHKHTLYEAQLIELDARRFQKQTLEYIAQKLEQKKGIPDRAFMYAVRQCVSRERSEVQRLLRFFKQSDLIEIEQGFREHLKKQVGYEQIDFSNISFFEDAMKFLQSKNQYDFVEGKPIHKINACSDINKIDELKEEIVTKKTRIRYRGTKKFR